MSEPRYVEWSVHRGSVVDPAELDLLSDMIERGELGAGELAGFLSKCVRLLRDGDDVFLRKV